MGLKQIFNRKLRPFTVAVVFAVLFLWGLEWALTNRQTHAWDRTSREFTAFGHAIGVYRVAHGEFPGANLSDAIQKMRNDETLSKYRSQPMKDCPRLSEGIDGWGRKVSYEISGDHKSVVIRSRGNDGMDDGGRGDDIQIVIRQDGTVSFAPRQQ